MLFNSVQYLIFLPVVVTLFWLSPRAAKMPLLLVASYIFYATWNPPFVLLIIGLTLFNFFWGKYLSKATDEKRKQIFTWGIIANIATLAFFKYTNFLLGTVASAVHLVTKHPTSFEANIVLPLGISFFVFEFIHYLFEVNKGGKPVDSFIHFALFAAFFPTQIAGPIKRYDDFMKQMSEYNPLKLEYFDEGLPLIITGLAKKLLFADNLAILVQMGFSNPGAYGAPELWLFTYAFAFQIYFDFSAYTDIARGSAMLFGYHIPINFNMPYIAANMSDFWRRWHISLSTWLRDYLFIPMGGSRVSNWKINRNMLITFALGGLWHGASWSFVVWGLFHGMCLVVHREFVRLKERLPKLEPLWKSSAFHYFSMFLTFQAVCIGDVFFRIQDSKAAFAAVKKMVLMNPIFSAEEGHQFFIAKETLPIIVPVTVTMVAVLLLANLPLSKMIDDRAFDKVPPFMKGAFCAVLIIAMVVLIPNTSAPFVYFQF
ncbi:MAG TPA: MBOAT family O-acyltransferase [Drouetiella sp.]